MRECARGFVGMLLVLATGCSSERGFRFYGDYEAARSRYTIRLISQGYVEPGYDLATAGIARVRFCPAPDGGGRAFFMTLLNQPGQPQTIESSDASAPSGESGRRNAEHRLREMLSRNGYRDVAEDELRGTLRVVESSLSGPKGVVLEGQIASLNVRRADIVYGYRVEKDRPPRDWIRASELPRCGAR